MKNQRLYNIDLVRILACMMIVLMHSPMPGMGTPGIVLSGVSMLTAPGIGLFFMVSGALLLRQKADAFDTQSFLKKRFTKILIPLAFWSAVGYLLSNCGIKNTELGILWFMYTLAGLYLLTPILIRWLSVVAKWEVELYLLLWLLSLCYPFVKMIFPLNESDTSWIYYFHGYVGYYVLGYYLQKYPFDKLRWCLLSILFGLFSIVAPIGVIVFHIKVDFYSVFWYLSISTAMWCVLWWQIIGRVNLSRLLSDKAKTIITHLSSLCFGIYLVHILVMRNILWKMEWMHSMSGVLQILACSILTLAISLIICFILSKIKYVRAVIGF